MPLQQVRDLDVGVAIVASLTSRAPAEQRVRLVEEQHRPVRRRRRTPAEVLLRLADVLAHHRDEVHLDQVEPERAGDDLGGRGLTGAARAEEERHGGPRPHVAAPVEAPVASTVARWRAWPHSSRSSVATSAGSTRPLPLGAGGHDSREAAKASRPARAARPREIGEAGASAARARAPSQRRRGGDLRHRGGKAVGERRGPVGSSSAAATRIQAVRRAK